MQELRSQLRSASCEVRRSLLFSITGTCVTPALLAQTTGTPGASTVAVPIDDALMSRIPAVLGLAELQYRWMLEQIRSSVALPRSYINNALKLVSSSDWTSGFFAGSLWFLHEYTGDAQWSVAARDYMHRVEKIKYFQGDHDVGFMINNSFGNGFRLTHDRSYRKVLLLAARSLATRFNPRVGMIRSWDFGGWRYPVIIDNLMNLELLLRAAQEGGETRLADIAIEHAKNTMQHHFRADSSSVHLVDFDPQTGAVLKKQTVQGVADSSAWSRGQAWGLYGYTMLFRETRQPAFLAQAQRIAQFIMSHPRLPADKIPYWDFDAPDIPDTYRDTSAAAITASALIELSSFSEPQSAGQYLQFARAQLLSLTSPDYLAQPRTNGGFLLMHAVGNRPGNVEIDVPLNFADYYLLEGLLRYQKLIKRP